MRTAPFQPGKQDYLMLEFWLFNSKSNNNFLDLVRLLRTISIRWWSSPNFTSVQSWAKFTIHALSVSRMVNQRKTCRTHTSKTLTASSLFMLSSAIFRKKRPLTLRLKNLISWKRPLLRMSSKPASLTRLNRLRTMIKNGRSLATRRSTLTCMLCRNSMSKCGNR